MGAGWLLGVLFARNPILAGGQPPSITKGHGLDSRHGWLGGAAFVQGGASQGLQAPHQPEGLKSP